ncbi:PREDICTED: uncharacterized protein At1g51745-like [Nelumbo nucifera]|uniref:Uncharacterized protein At1g51745-like n=2 Tax=Nelumbo nucifera TaxID=4432 RepID=A0A1U8ALX5_NELNU|nr:PREDICTED: uncharacterized protein At1g51745-like [Nelumbo nucifera]XP_010267046.1 PREDICTED: uncharacterized protein At1g51745-like [Nelumbo nucifera]DAD48930.1 TPA_asm: hypothetical protein HUJ06_018867 [Nelumbo nucifera]
MEGDCEANTKGIDCSVGGLVWVRRRNGSWWPGRIMGLDELSESCLVSPRSGTPVKLLGREDASVDWYNLEKSKRVKAFRCGEYDECIEKAKAAAAQLNKKTVKYARREDAILHALELESARKSNEAQEFCLRMDYPDDTDYDTWSRQSQKMFGPIQENEHTAGKVSSTEGNSAQELTQSGISFEDPDHISMPTGHAQKKKRKTPNDSEDDGTEGTKRMRGLEDLGMRVALKRKSNMHFPIEGSIELVQLDSASLSDSNIGNSLSNGSPVNSSRVYCSSLKKRQSQVNNVYEGLKRKNRRRPLTKVLESTAMVAVPVVCEQSASPGGSSFQGITDSKISTIESIESKKTSFSVIINNNSDSTGASCEKETSLNASEQICDAGVDVAHFHSEMKDGEFSSMSELPDNDCSDSLFDVPFVAEEKHNGGFSTVFASCSSGKLQTGAVGMQASYCSQFGPTHLRAEGLDESGSTSFAALDCNASHRIEKGSSKWQSKGKRNMRNLRKKTSKNLKSRRPINYDDQEDAYLVDVQQADEFSVGLNRKVGINSFERSHTSENCAQQARTKLLSEDLKDASRNWNKQYSQREYQVGQPRYLNSIKYGRQVSGHREVAFHTAESKDGLSLSNEKYVVARPTTQVRNKESFLTRRMPVSPLMSHRSLPLHQSRFTTYPRYQTAGAPRRNISGTSTLFDVNLDVRASYRGQHVPLVSLMSKLNGKAIIGHPVTVEVLDTGYRDLQTSNTNYCAASSGTELYDISKENISDQSINVSNSSPIPEEGDNAGVNLQAETVEPQSNQALAKHLTVQPTLLPKKSPKFKKSGLLSKKTRKLSSLTVSQDHREGRKPVVENSGPVIACVPLKVVFSRLKAAVNCSTRPVHHVSASTNP